ncbi:unnamed protein product [Bemisia tabaci]|uniref:Metalloendopeptidase n=1 Tax=Bemisia tabaci TaxID=7038 RepID=A0A9P0AIM5_BEMTA|nr:unnamed protein product [Bemisia tabaci]
MLIFKTLLLALAAEEVFSIKGGTPDEFAEFRSNPKLRTKKRLKNWEDIWKGGGVIYQWDHSTGCPNPSSDNCKIVIDAMRRIMEETCVRFKERSGETDYVRFVLAKATPLPAPRPTSCSFVRRTRQEQRLEIHQDYWQTGVILHELGHVLGLQDEALRPDRDATISVAQKNIYSESLKRKFDKIPTEKFNFLGQPFDPDSIMMWPKNMFGKGRTRKAGYEETITSKRSSVRLKDSLNEKLSDSDVARIRDLYRCDEANQKPRFPVDTACSFDDHRCGFKGLYDDYSFWEWIPWKNNYNQDNRGILNWYYIVAKKECNDRMEDRTWSVGYYGLSPLDTKRGPEGCVTFKYMLRKNYKGLHTIRLMMRSLHSPLDAIMFTETSSPGVEIWSTDTRRLEEFRNNRWIRASVPVNVQSPFLLHFESILEENGAGKYSVKIDDLAVRYTPCEGAVSDMRFKCFSRKTSRTLPRSSSGTSMGSPRNRGQTFGATSKVTMNRNMKT